jgi:hypothetical protein
MAVLGLGLLMFRAPPLVGVVLAVGIGILVGL